MFQLKSCTRLAPRSLPPQKNQLRNTLENTRYILRKNAFTKKQKVMASFSRALWTQLSRWDAKRKSDKLTLYQLVLYKHYFCLKHNIDPKNVEIHFALLKRTAKKKRVEFFRVTSGKRKTENALKLLYQSLYNIVKGVSIKNRLRCYKPYSCDLRGTTHCPKWQDSTGTSHDRKNQDLHDK